MAFGSCNIPARTQYSCKDPILHPAAPAPRVLRSQRALRQAASPTHGSSSLSRHPHASPTSCAPIHRRVPAASQTNSRSIMAHGNMCVARVSLASTSPARPRAHRTPRLSQAIAHCKAQHGLRKPAHATHQPVRTRTLTHALLRRCWQPEREQRFHTRSPAHPFVAGSSQSSWRASPRPSKALPPSQIVNFGKKDTSARQARLARHRLPHRCCHRPLAAALRSSRSWRRPMLRRRKPSARTWRPSASL